MDWQRIREQFLRDESMRKQIALRAFEIYASRGYVAGHEVADWFEAENELWQQFITTQQELTPPEIEQPALVKPKKNIKKRVETEADTQPIKKSVRKKKTPTTSVEGEAK